MGAVTGVTTLLATDVPGVTPCISVPLSLVVCSRGRDLVEGRPLLFQPMGVTIVLPTIFLACKSAVLVVVVVVVAVVVTTVANIPPTDVVVGENIGGDSFSNFPERLPNRRPVVIRLPPTPPVSLSL